MGSEDLHHKRKQNNKQTLQRLQNMRDTYELALIVCEGEKTEPNYLRGLRDYLQLNSANIKVLGVGTDPLCLVKYALNEFSLNKDYDQVFCVFDKDQHARYQDAINKIKAYNGRKTNRIPIRAIPSVPCFEYWLLLHYLESTKPYFKNGNKSAGDQLFLEIKKHIPNYKKGYQDVFSFTKNNLPIAIRRAKKIDKLQETNKTDNPTTKIYQLVEYLMNIKNNGK